MHFCKNGNIKNRCSATFAVWENYMYSAIKKMQYNQCNLSEIK